MMSRWMVLVLLCLPVVLAECPNGADCSDDGLLEWVIFNPTLIGQIEDVESFNTAWDFVSNDERQAIIKQDNDIYNRLDETQKLNLVKNPATARDCRSCIDDFAQNDLSSENYAAVLETMHVFILEEEAASKYPDTFAKISNLETGGTLTLDNQLLSDDRYPLSTSPTISSLSEPMGKGLQKLSLVDYGLELV